MTFLRTFKTFYGLKIDFQCSLILNCTVFYKWRGGEYTLDLHMRTAANAVFFHSFHTTTDCSLSWLACTRHNLARVSNVVYLSIA